jgi:hypothetical protein
MSQQTFKDLTSDDFDDFSDDELSPEELQMTVAKELTLRWLYDKVWEITITFQTQQTHLYR